MYKYKWMKQGGTKKCSKGLAEDLRLDMSYCAVQKLCLIQSLGFYLSHILESFNLKFAPLLLHTLLVFTKHNVSDLLG